MAETLSDFIDEAPEPEEPVDPLTDSELEKLSSQAPESWSGTRNRLIMRHMLYTGARVGETVEQDLEDLNLEEGILDISPAKWYGERRLHISDSWADRLRKFLENPETPESDFLFPNERGGMLSTRYVRYFIEDYALRSDLSAERIHPHLFRHTFASRLLAVTGNLRTVQNALGHNDIKTTMIYLHTLNDKQLEEIKAQGIVDLAEFEKSLPNVEATAEQRKE